MSHRKVRLSMSSVWIG